MRIAIIAPPWAPVPPTHYGAVEVIVEQLALGFQANGHEVLLCTTGDSRCPVPRHVTRARSAGDRIGQAVIEFGHGMDAYDTAQRCDIVHDHTIVGPAYAHRFPDLPVVATVHGPLDDEHVAVYARAGTNVATVAISASQCESVRGFSVAGVIHHGLDANRFTFGPARRDFCLFLGRMAPEKGAHLAIDAARKAHAPLALAGKVRSAAEHAYFEAEVAPRLSDDDGIFFVGEVDDDRKRTLLAKASCLLFPILWHEPFGLVQLEAMASGTPVVAFPKGATPEIVEHGQTGFLCRDGEDMARAIRRIGELDRAACRAAVEGHFSARRMVGDYLALFERILDRRRRRAAS